ncbi:Uncharacterised protein [Legionella busanensis]|uniref:Uncharacterized protein n=1 Tax=Legionella busanensis TaxID=190655 RepID=A0A378JLY2_9GAMM|nr:hypothetical protein [Legionella busanensis]STX51090.1 Uncharacterised protein [Legionella busanensis]
MMLQPTKINIETLILVAIWETPFIFQGCFQIIESTSEIKILYFFRCQYVNSDTINTINNDFSPYDYEFSYLHDETNLISLDNLDEASEFAIYVLKYVLHTTLLEMIKHKQKNLIFIDDMAMEAMIERIKPAIKHNVLTNIDDDLGFATSIEFMTQEKSAQLAANTLLTKFAEKKLSNISFH